MATTAPTNPVDEGPHVGGVLRVRLAEGRAEIQTLHTGGALGLQISSALVDLCDQIVRDAYKDALEAAPPSGRLPILQSLSLVAVGGYGRGDLAPHSDVDLLFLTASSPPAIVREFVAGLVRNLWDIGLKLSQSMRSPGECVSFAKMDFAARTALFEARLVAGNVALFADLQRRVHRLIASTSIGRLIDEACGQRVKEREDYYAETALLLEPNVKKSAGGLRDIHLLRWVSLAGYGTCEPDMLRLSGVLSSRDAHVVTEVWEYLHRIRNELHFHADTAQDVLTREEQIRLAEWLGFSSEGPLLSVERFMQQYYRQVTDVQDVVTRFLDKARRPGWLQALAGSLLTRRVADYLVVRHRRLVIDRNVDDSLLGQCETLLQLFELARNYDVPPDFNAIERARGLVPGCVVTPKARAGFLQHLANPSGLGGYLRSLHRVGLLERLLPPFAHARCLIQFNLLHHYTVDEHSIRMVEAASRRLDDAGPLGRAYHEIRRKDILHLAILLHDLGKGLGENHCEVGRRLAEQTADEFAMVEHDRRLLTFLVHRHLVMAHTAFRRDLSDIKTIVQFTRGVGTPEALRMLYVLTAADTEAVAPGEWTAWKESLLSELYSRAMEELTGEAPVADERERAEVIRRSLRERLRDRFRSDWLEAQLAAMPPAYLMTTEPDRLAAHLQTLQGLPAGGVRVVAKYLAELRMMQYTVFTHDDIAPGLFAKIAGVFAAAGFQISDAQIVTRSDGIVVDTFHGVDMDFAGEPPMARRQELAGQIENVLLGRQAVEDLLSRRGSPMPRGRSKGPAEPPQAEIDNDTSDHFTIIDVFAEDRLGLLHAIAQTLFEEGISIYSAKISTHYDQIVDVFYVTTRDGQKVADTSHLDHIRRRLLDVI